MLPVGDDCGAGLGVTATVSLCHILNNLSLSGQQHVRAIVNAGALPRIVTIGRCEAGAAHGSPGWLEQSVEKLSFSQKCTKPSE